ncbi:DUF2157 domain-containing protein [Pedobacter psychroterrae]|uniref:DUF2157 domain-containing protein n=1 Tax=Pedobacter psychroterrae TaxID=2530453 RepID=A0A4R0NR26_9SPHI|nr:DUF2157 domain-containing protein [Pedobacter psychroterrae]TCD02498.1 DUF2157 domain-containing protein [Pedobacter psychroterrae]
MKERRLTRNVIQIISRYKGLSATEIKTLFKDEGIYADKSAWAKFIDAVLLSMGTAFLVAGAIFFFAYNWDELHKFVKLGIVQFLILTGIAAVFLVKPNLLVKNIILTGTSMLVGLLFSVFGQIYQTGADAYDFFLGWTVFIFLWAVVSEFAPLWLLLLALINITFSLYVSQIGPDWTAVTTYLILSMVNLAAVILVKYLASKNYITSVPGWFDKIVVIMAVSCLTTSLVSGIFGRYPPVWFIALAVCFIIYSAGVGYALRHKSIYLLCLISLSVLIILVGLVWEILKVNNEFVLLLIGLVIVACITVLVRELAKLNKSWYGDN